jgi:hypothetical protein
MHFSGTALYLLTADTRSLPEDHIRISCRIAGWPPETAAAMIAAGIGPCEAARLFRDAMARPQ